MESEKTLVVIKPDGYLHVEKIEKLFRECGFKALHRADRVLDSEEVSDFYAEHVGKPYFPGMVEYMTGGVCRVLVLSGENVMRRVRDLAGSTKPEDASPGTIRAQFGTPFSQPMKNAIHSSDSVENLEREYCILVRSRTGLAMADLL